MKKNYSLEEIEIALDEAIKRLEKSIKLAEETDIETAKEEKEIVKHIMLGTAKMFKEQVLENLTIENKLQELAEKITELFK